MREKIILIYRIKNLLFFVLLGALSVTGLLWFARPKTSEIEKRELTAFPKLTAAGLLDGSFTSGVDKWYSDTYPLRERLIGGANKLRSLYGDRSEQIIIRDTPADDIPDPVTRPTGTQPSPADTRPPATGPAPTDTQSASTDTQPPATQPPQDTGSDEPEGPVGEKVGSIYVSGDAAYSLYYFNKTYTAQYADLLNRAHQLMGDGVQIYSLIVPLSSGVLLSKSRQTALGVSDQKAAIDYINSLMDPAIHGLNVYDTMKAHDGEYIYFRTDHHWTALGAYYAYTDFCRAKGVTAHTLDQFEHKEYPGFLGSFYSDTLSDAMKNDPDTVEAWVPMGTNSMIYVDRSGNEYNWNVIRNASNNSAGGKYYCFAGSDQPYAYAHNPAITDGSACVIVKDSFGNAYVPFMIDHYEHIYWIDFRYYKDTLPNLVKEKGITDVLFCLNMYNVTSSGALQLLERLVP